MSRPIRASFDSSALKHNLGVARQLAGSARTLAVIKANAYGHGLLRAARALAAADGFALLELDDAIRLRDAGYRQPIVLLEGFFAEAELAPILQNGLSVVLHNAEQLEMLKTLPGDRKLDVFVKFNTGMNRLGFPAESAASILQQLDAMACIGERVLATHFSDAEGVSGIELQMTSFERHVARPGFKCSLANSAALLRFPEARGDWVRPGIMLYGCSPFADQTAGELGLKPAMTLTSELVGTQHLHAGERVGYGFSYEAAGEMTIGIVACGYADGYPRHAPTGTPVLVNGKRARIVGRVSMDMISIDISDIPEATIGSPVTLWGEGLSADEIGAAAGTLSYELLCKLTARVPVVEA